MGGHDSRYCIWEDMIVGIAYGVISRYSIWDGRHNIWDGYNQ